MNDFSEKLKALRKEKDLTQKELAEQLGYTQSNISEWEKSTVEPKLTALKTIATFFDISIDYLSGMEDDFGQISQNLSAPTYSAEEIQLIKDYRSLAPQLKRMIQETIKTFKQADSKSKTNKGDIA